MDTTPGNSELYRKSHLRFLQKEQLKEEALKDPFHYLAADLTTKRISDIGNFKIPLGNKKFEKAEQHSKGCISISVKASEIPDGGLNPYVAEAINAFIVPISHYLSEVKKTPVIQNHDNFGTERTIFHIFKCSDIKDEKLVGAYFDDIYYKVRNEGQHIVIRNKNGTLGVKEKGKENAIKREVLKWFKGGLNPLLRLYKNIG